MGQVEFVVTGNVRNLEQELTRAEKRIERLEQAAKRAGKALDGAGAAESAAAAATARVNAERKAAGLPYAPGPIPRTSRKENDLYLAGLRERYETGNAAEAQRRRRRERIEAAGYVSNDSPQARAARDAAVAAALAANAGDESGGPDQNARLAAEQARRERDARDNARLARDKAARDAERERMKANELVGGKRRRSGAGGGGGGDSASGDDELERFRREMAGAFSGIRDRVDNLATSSRTASGNLSGLQLGLMGITGATVAAGYAAAEYVRILEETTQQASDARLKFDVMQRTAATSSGVSGLSMDRLPSDVLGLAHRFAVPSEYAFDITEAARRSGMGLELSRGAGAEALLSVAAAMNATNRAKGDIDPQLLPKVLSGMLKAEGRPFDAVGITRIGGYARAAYAGQMELSDLPDLAKILATLRGTGLQTDESTAAFAALRDVAIPAPEASTGLRNVVGRLARAGASEAKIRALRKMGLSPGDVDFQGEDLSTVLDRLAAGAGRLDPVARNIELTRIFEERGVATANTLLDPETRNRIREYVGSMRRPGSLEPFVESATSGPAAQRQRRETAGEALALSRSGVAQGEERIRLFQQLLEERGDSSLSASLRANLARMEAWIKDLFVDSETAYKTSIPVTMRRKVLEREASDLRGAENIDNTQILLRQMQAAEETVRLLKQQMLERQGPKPRAGAGGGER